MQEIYIRNYANGMMLRASLDLLWRHLSWPPEENALTMGEWGRPFYLTSNIAPYVPVFIRAADRSLYHATNAWRHLAADLSVIPHLQFKLETDALLQTNDRATKYEIEAFLGSVMSITEKNLIGDKKRNRLGKSLALGEPLISQLRTLAEEFHALGTDSKWRAIRNNAYHLNPELTTDWGVLANIRKIDERYVVKLEGVHYVDGVPADLIELFTDSFNAFISYATNVRGLLTQFYLQSIAVPQHNTYSCINDPLGNMIIGFGKDGYDLRYFPETASDFVGPLKAVWQENQVKNDAQR